LSVSRSVILEHESKRLAWDVLELMIWIMNSETETLFNFAKVNKGETNENEEWNQHSEESVRHVENKHVVIVDSQEVE